MWTSPTSGCASDEDFLSAAVVDFKDENSRAVLFKNNKRYIKISSFMSLMSLMMMSLAEEWGRGGAAGSAGPVTEQ